MDSGARLKLARARPSISTTPISSLSRQASFERDYASDSATSTHSSVFSSSRHVPALSASSSFELSPAMSDTVEFPSKRNGLSALPELSEDPAELDAHFALPPSPAPSHKPHITRFSEDLARPSHSSARRTMELDPEFSSDVDDDYHFAKRRRSGSQNWNQFADGVRSAFGSLSRKSRHQKRASASAAFFRRSAFPPSPSPSPQVRSRATSRSLSFRRSDEKALADTPQEYLEHCGPLTNWREEGLGSFLGDAKPHQCVAPEHLEVVEDAEPPRSTTPLLPRFADRDEPAESALSPLQSPTFAVNPKRHTMPALNSFANQPECYSPVASREASFASFQRGLGITLGLSDDITPLYIADPNDEWAEKLGHSNFTIYPEPYVPDQGDARAIAAEFLGNWETARSEYAIHRLRTETTYGQSSKIFKLTEQKWAWLDAQWKRCNELLPRAADGYPSPVEPAPVATTAHIDDPRFVQSEDIVGPMKVEPARTSPPPPDGPSISRKSSKRNSILKLFVPHRQSRSFSGTWVS